VGGWGYNQANSSTSTGTQWPAKRRKGAEREGQKHKKERKNLVTLVMVSPLPYCHPSTHPPVRLYHANPWWLAPGCLLQETKFKFNLTVLKEAVAS
jgi:hypothetical protein